MKITELLSKQSVALGVKVDSKDAAIDYLVNLHYESGNIPRTVPLRNRDLQQ